MRIFIGPIEVAGIGVGLKKGFAELGVDAEVCLNSPHPFQYEDGGTENRVVRLWQMFHRWHQRSVGRSNVLRLPVWAGKVLCSFAVLFWSLVRFDTYIFLFGRSITESRLELMLLKMLGKRVVFVYLGSDARPAYMDGSICAEGMELDFERIRAVTRARKRRIRLQESMGFTIINSPFTSQFNEKPYVNSFKLGVPRYFDQGSSQGDLFMGPSLKVVALHSPSHPEAKGSAHIVQCIENLQNKGFNVVLKLLQGVPNAQVIASINTCHLIIDQLYSDLPLSSFGMEGAHGGKAVVTAGYSSALYRRYLDVSAQPPSVFIQPDQLEAALEELLSNPDKIKEQGAVGERFVKGQWSPMQVAARYLKVLEGAIPSDYLAEPGACVYFGGSGVPQERIRSIACELEARYGIESLGMEHSEKLQLALRKFMAGGPCSA